MNDMWEMVSMFFLFSSAARMYVCWVLVHKTDTSPHLPFVDTSRRWLGVEIYSTVYVGVTCLAGRVRSGLGACCDGDLRGGG
jgi:hypothetical protein